MLVTERHMGDFGNIVGDTEGMVNETITVKHVYLWGAFNVMDRAWVLHAGEDDLGQGGDAGSLATGGNECASPPPPLLCYLPLS
jgi:Cu-Zn family superoxide dismutase